MSVSLIISTYFIRTGVLLFFLYRVFHLHQLNYVTVAPNNSLIFLCNRISSCLFCSSSIYMHQNSIHFSLACITLVLIVLYTTLYHLQSLFLYHVHDFLCRHLFFRVLIFSMFRIFSHCLQHYLFEFIP